MTKTTASSAFVMARVMTDAVNRAAKGNREVTGRVNVPVESSLTAASSRNARASAARWSPKEAAGKLLARRHELQMRGRIDERVGRWLDVQVFSAVVVGGE